MLLHFTVYANFGPKGKPFKTTNFRVVGTRASRVDTAQIMCQPMVADQKIQTEEDRATVLRDQIGQINPLMERARADATAANRKGTTDSFRTLKRIISNSNLIKES